MPWGLKGQVWWIRLLAPVGSKQHGCALWPARLWHWLWHWRCSVSTRWRRCFVPREIALDVCGERIFPLCYGPGSVHGKVHMLPLDAPSLLLPATASGTQTHSTQGPVPPQGAGQKTAVTAHLPQGPLIPGAHLSPATSSCNAWSLPAGNGSGVPGG